MNRPISVITVVTLCFMLLQLLLADCPYKGCSCSYTDISCTGNNMTEIRLVGTNITGYLTLFMEENQITAIPAGSFPPGLTNINFNGNPISAVDDYAFGAVANTLKELVLDRTNFTKIPYAFGHLSVLTFLQLTNNNITDWNEDIMKVLGQTLLAIDLENVGLTAWPAWLQNYSSLNEITFIGNSFPSIPENALDNFVDTLKSLTLNKNRLTMVPKAISKLKNLESLYLQQNLISDVSFLPHLSTGLSTLSISYNRISDAVQLSQALKPFAGRLNSFDINDNLLTSIPDLSNLTQIGDLDFSDNTISDSFSGSLQPNLYSLGMSHNLLVSVPQVFVRLLLVKKVRLTYNSITTIQATDFHSQTDIVDLGYNMITELTDSSFHFNSSISFLELNNNPIISISEGALKNLPNLFELNLESTKIARLPLGLRYLVKLGVLDVGNIDGLVCTCLEKSLTAWLLHLQQRPTGNCGHISVDDFFRKLSPSCP